MRNVINKIFRGDRIKHCFLLLLTCPIICFSKCAAEKKIDTKSQVEIKDTSNLAKEVVEIDLKDTTKVELGENRTQLIILRELNNPKSSSLSDYLQLAGIAIGFLGALVIYWKQRRDNARDAYQLFQDSLALLDEAIEDSGTKLSQFRDSLANSNDNFTNPILSPSLNDKFINKIDLSALIRYYKCKHPNQLSSLKTFLKQLGFIGSYHDFFLNELNYFRGHFLEKENLFVQYKLLLSTVVNDVVAHNYEPHNNEFMTEYALLIQRVFQDNEITQNGEMKNRELLNERFIIPLLNLTSQHIHQNIDLKANEVNQLANQVNSARQDMDSIKQSMAAVIKKDVEHFERLKRTVSALLNKA